jgi:hypothetical protein
MRATTVEQAVRYLREAAEAAAERNQRWGYFAALYHRVTKSIGERIEAGYFEDAARMGKLDVAFANRYFDALDAYLEGRDAPTRAWRVALETTERPEATILQHLYLGLNAHLLIDLGVAAAETCPKGAISGVRGDFFRINDAVRDLMDGFHRDLAVVSPALGRLEHKAGWAWKQGSMLVLGTARAVAWRTAERLAPRDPEGMAAGVEEADGVATFIARRIATPSWLERGIWRSIRAEESDDARDIIRRLL